MGGVANAVSTYYITTGQLRVGVPAGPPREPATDRIREPGDGCAMRHTGDDADRKMVGRGRIRGSQGDPRP